ncbi:hypothetical protein Busp01_33880 [Trinickia caryophylli]|nr:hypothetical protein Busp01_33880 [Trinickia caryophylli]
MQQFGRFGESAGTVDGVKRFKGFEGQLHGEIQCLRGSRALPWEAVDAVTGRHRIATGVSSG